MVFVVFLLVGAAAQFVDGMLGLGFGVTSATLLTLLGYSAVAASASTHAAKMGTGLVSGLSHWRAGNVDWRLVAVIGIPGAFGAFVGAVALTTLVSSGSQIVMAALLMVLGLGILFRFAWRRSLVPALRLQRRHLWPVGLLAGAIDSAGGGGWGPVATPTLLSTTVQPTYRIVGSVNTAEFFVAVSASLGFLVAGQSEAIPWLAVLGLVAGGALTAPLAARLVHKSPSDLLGILVAGMVLVANMAVIAKVGDLPGTITAIALSMIALLMLAAQGSYFRNRRRVATVAQSGESDSPEPLVADDSGG